MYGELVIGLNMLFNYAILLFANRVGNVGVKRGRLLFASFVGAVPVTFFPTSAIAVFIAFIGMTVCAFGKAFERWKKSAVMVLVGAVFAGGLLTALQYQARVPSGKFIHINLCVDRLCSLYFMRKKWLDIRIVHSVSALHAETTVRMWGRYPS